MSLAVPVLANWSFDFGDVTNTQLTAAAMTTAMDIAAELTAARTAASGMILSGAFGSTSATYRVIARADATSPNGYSVDIKLTPAT